MQHTFDLIHDFIVPKAQNTVSLRFQKCSPLGIVLFLLQMLAAIQFDDEFPAGGTEVNHIITDSMLVPKMDILYPVRA
jgi:hypothetical protein